MSKILDASQWVHCRGEGANAALHHCSDSTETLPFRSVLAPGNNCSGYCCNLHQHVKHVFSTSTQELCPVEEPSKILRPVRSLKRPVNPPQAPEQFLNTLEGQRAQNHRHLRRDTRSQGQTCRRYTVSISRNYTAPGCCIGVLFHK